MNNDLLLEQIKRAGHVAHIAHECNTCGDIVGHKCKCKKGDTSPVGVMVVKQAPSIVIGRTQVGIMVQYKCKLNGIWLSPKPYKLPKDGANIKYLIKIVTNDK